MHIAREAFQEFELSSQYIYNFQHSDTLKDLMHQIGTQYILITSNDPYWQDLLENNSNYPLTLGWNLINTNKDTGPDIEIILTETDFYIGGDESSSSTCSQSFQVEDGVEIKKVWSEKDSAYIEIREQKYKTVAGQVVNYEQSKSAKICVELYWSDNQTNRQIFRENIYANYIWSNQYSERSGDIEATSRRTNYGGSCSIYPSKGDMADQVTQTMLELLVQHLEDQLSELKY